MKLVNLSFWALTGAFCLGYTKLNFFPFDEKVQGKDRLVVKSVAEQLGLEGSYVPRTYIEQIQLEKLVNEVMVWQFVNLIMPFHALVVVI